MKKVVVAILALLATAIIVVSSFLLIGERPINHDDNDGPENTNPTADDATTTPRVNTEHASSTSNEPSVEVDTNDNARRLAKSLDDVLAGDTSILAFIKNNIEGAQNGDPDAAFYVALALNTCGSDLMSLGMTIEILTNTQEARPPITKSRIDELRSTIAAQLADKHEFYRIQAERKIDRAIDCLELGPAQDILAQGHELMSVAMILGQPLATIMMDEIDVASLTVDDLIQLREKTRSLLQKNKDREIFFYSAVVSAASLELDHTFETLAWAIAACNYNSCDTLSRYYRGRCELMSLRGTGHFCSDDITDYDYLLLKYPDQFDRARARAMEITTAIDAERWEDLGL